MRAVCAFRVTWSEQVFFRPIVSDTSSRYIDREGLGIALGGARDWVAAVSIFTMGLSWVRYRFFLLAIPKFRRKLYPNLSHSANRHKTYPLSSEASKWPVTLNGLLDLGSSTYYHLFKNQGTTGPTWTVGTTGTIGTTGQQGQRGQQGQQGQHGQ